MTEYVFRVRCTQRSSLTASWLAGDYSITIDSLVAATEILRTLRSLGGDGVIEPRAAT